MTRFSASNPVRKAALNLGQKLYAFLMIVWEKWGEPVYAFEQESELYRTRFVSASLLSLAFLAGGILPLRYILLPLDDQTILRASIALVAGLILLIAQRFAYHGRYMLASWIAILTASSAVTVAGVFILGRVDSLYFFMIVPVYAAAIMPVRRLIEITAIHSIAMLLIATIAGPERGQRIFEEPFINFLVLSFMVILIVAYRNYIERQAWARIQRSEKRHRIISELVSDYAYAVKQTDDGKYVFEWVTDSFAKLLGHDKAQDMLEIDLTYQLYLNLVMNEEILQVSLDQAFAGEQTLVEIPYRKQDGTIGWIELHRQPELDPKTGEVIRVYGVGRNISNRKAAEAQAEVIALQQGRLRLIQEFVHAISHDFRTSLSNVETHRYLIERKTADHGINLSSNLDIVQLYIKRMTRQLDGMTEIAEISDIMTQKTSIEDLFQHVNLLYSSAAKAKQIELDTRLPTNDLALWIDANKVRQAICRLVENAITYTPEGGSITLDVRDTPESTIIRLTDDGEGIPPEHLTRIFDLFYRVDTSRNVHTGGVGIGLSLVRFVMQAHKGDVNVTSEPGKGSQFELVFPKTHIRTEVTPVIEPSLPNEYEAHPS
ncbi:MAG: hypothetical protein CL607_27860 [Anaerolineaceae bacterium]|nr:hypothetical protein [Anaerolineaceae bacterium]